jgi:hypothetical protein
MADNTNILEAYDREDRESQQVRAQVSTFKGQKYFSLRSWYPAEPDGEYKPGKNGINLPIDEYPKFRALIDALDIELDYVPVEEESDAGS